MVGKPTVELGLLSVCRTWDGISIADAIPKRLDEFESLSRERFLDSTGTRLTNTRLTNALVVPRALSKAWLPGVQNLFV
jgi:hypothetical protein